MKKLWGRVAMSCTVSDEEYETLIELMKTAPGDAANMLDTLFTERGERDGNDYLVAGCDDNPNVYDDFDF